MNGDTYEVKELRREVTELKQDFISFKKETREKFTAQAEKIDNLETKTTIHDEKINNVMETLREIKGDTKWLRQTITGAIITAAIGGVVSLVIFLIQKGG